MHFWGIALFPTLQIIWQKYWTHSYCPLAYVGDCVCVGVWACVYHLMSRIHTLYSLIFPLMCILSCIMLTFWRANKHNSLIKYFLLPAPYHTRILLIYGRYTAHTYTQAHTHSKVCILFISVCQFNAKQNVCKLDCEDELSSFPDSVEWNINLKLIW